jgi:hypothetical protein
MPDPTSDSGKARSKLRHGLEWALFVAWAAPLVLIGSVLMVGHWVPLPTPSKTALLDRAIGELVGPSDGRWNMVHVLYSQCSCSARIFEYLLSRPSPTETGETVLLVEPNERFATRARERGFRVEQIKREALKERFGIEAAPLLLIADPQGVVRYAGGYTLQKQGLDYHDLEFLDRLRSGSDVAELLAYGCGVSRELQSYLDPLGVKYAP